MSYITHDLHLELIDELDENNDKIDDVDIKYNPKQSKPGLTIKLHEHQKTILHKMLEVERTGKITINVMSTESSTDTKNEEKDNMAIFEINTQVAILGDKVGAGKTIDALALICLQKLITIRPTIVYGNHYFSCNYISTTSNNINLTLIIVPPKLIIQWIEACNFVKGINFYFIKSTKDYTKLFEKLSFDDFDVIIITSTMYNDNCVVFRQLIWNRIIIDEPNTITLPVDFGMFNFLWLISGTPNSLIEQRHKYLYRILLPFRSRINSPFIDYGIFNKCIIKNKNSYIDNIIKLPDIIKIYIKCISSLSLVIKSFKQFIPDDVLTLIHADNIQEAMKQLNCNIETSDNIIKILTDKIVIDIKNITSEIEYETKKIYHVEADKIQKINHLNNNLNALNDKYNNIISIINTNNICPICYDNVTNKTILSCCKNSFCFACITHALSINNKCPLCRNNVTKSDIIVIKDDIDNDIINLKTNIEVPEILLSKQDKLIEILQSNPNNKYIIFSDFQKTVDNINYILMASKFKFHEIKGQINTIQHKIQDFNNGIINILSLNSSNYGAGLNLQAATDIIIYHRLSLLMENQVIGRAQRYGRTTALKVHYLAYSNEYDI